MTLKRLLGFEEPHQSMLLDMRLNCARQAVKNMSAEPSQKDLEDVCCLLAAEAEIAVSTAQAARVLSLYPYVRISVAVNSVNDTETTGEVLSAFSDLLVGHPWPKYGDKLSEDEEAQFQRLLCNQWARIQGDLCT